MSTERLTLDEIVESQANKYLTHNTALRQIEGQLLGVISRSTAAEPSSPAEGDTYIVPAGATGTNWIGQDGNIAHYYSSTWHFYTPFEGLPPLWVMDEDLLIVYDGSAWSAVVSMQFPTGAKSTNYTVTVSDQGRVLLVDASAGAVTVTLPVAATAGNGFVVGVIKTDASSNAVTVDPDGTETIEGEASLLLERQWNGSLLDTDGVDQWVQIGGGGGGAALPLFDDDDLFANATDETKILKFSLSGLTPATTRTVSWPDKDGTVAMLSDVTGGGNASLELDEDSGTTTGLTWGWLAGLLRVGATIYEISAGTIILTDDTDNYVELDPADQTVKTNTTGFTAGRIPIRLVTTASGVQTVSTDRRAWLVGGYVSYVDGLTEELAAADQVISRPELKDYSETRTAPASAAGALTLDLANGNVFEVELTEATTLTFSNPPASGKGGSFTLILNQDATGGWAVTWPASVVWAGGTVPTLTSTASAVDVLTFITVDGGATWFGFLAGTDFS